MASTISRRRFLKAAGLATAAFSVQGVTSDLGFCSADTAKQRPNILWIVVEDMSLHWSCYGEKTIQTPNIDRLSSEGARFTHAFVCAPVCSPSRSAMITGMYHTTIGSHHHRSSYPGSEVKLPDNMKLLPEIFKDHGYYTANGGPKKTAYKNDPKGKAKKIAKTDYNFVWDKDVYDAGDWKGRSESEPFFAQIQLRGGKHRGAKVPNPVDPADVKLPPYYPDHPVIREDWARYLNSVMFLDIQVGKILKRLDDEGIADTTAVFLWTDHGISHARGKQFLYDEGMQVPLIVRWPGAIKAGTIRSDLVNHIDIAATSLSMAGINVPGYMQGQPLFGPDYKPRKWIFAARDRCDETLECMRALRTKRYKYIRNFYPYRPHLQSNRYKDGKSIIKTMRKLHAEGKLNEIQDRIFTVPRPVEEFYDLEKDPHEIKNLADSQDHKDILKRFRRILIWHIRDTKDLGLVPEPVIEELAVKYKSRFEILRSAENKNLLNKIIGVIEIGQIHQNTNMLIGKMKDKEPSVRWWAARELGNLTKDQYASAVLAAATLWDNSAAVRVASARALCKMGRKGKALPVLLKELKNENQVVRHYAALALEDTAPGTQAVYDAMKEAQQDKYEFVKRVSTRYVNNWKPD